MNIFYSFIIIWVVGIAVAYIAYVVLKALGQVSSGLWTKMPNMPKWGDSDLAHKWKALSVKEKIIVILIMIIPMAGAITYHHIKQQKKRA
jgi:hypothetical protein